MWKRIGSTATITVGLISSILSSAPLFCQAQLLSSFENNLSSSVGATWEGPGIPTSEFVPTGATDGTSALAIHHAPGWHDPGYPREAECSWHKRWRLMTFWSST